jgi:hypothetical protein
LTAREERDKLLKKIYGSEKIQQPGAILWQGRQLYTCRHSLMIVQLVHQMEDCDF